MRRFVWLTALGLAAPAAFAQQLGYETNRVEATFERQNGQWVAVVSPLPERNGPAIAWDRTTFPQGGAYYINSLVGDLWADWGDIQTGTVANRLTAALLVRRNEPTTWVFAVTEDDFGGAIGGADPNDPNTDANSPGTRDLLGAWQLAFTLPNTFPAVAAHLTYNINLKDVDPNDPVDDPISFAGPDLDGDGRTDFGYATGMVARGAGACGPSIFLAGPDPIGSPGAEDVVTFFSVTDPNADTGIATYFGFPDPNNIANQAGFVGNFVFQAPLVDPRLFAQFALRVWTDGACLDPDGDGICSSEDDCPNVADPNQTDTDGDGHGDACDLCPGQPLGDNGDNDGDGIGNPCDNCPDNANANQADCDADGIGDVCDPDGPCVTACPNPGCDDGGIDADFDNDCDVDLTDLAILLANFGTSTGMTNATGDTDNDGDADLTDLASLLARFGNNCNNP